MSKLIERLIFLNTIKEFWGLALGDDGFDPPRELELLPKKQMNAYLKERIKLLRLIARKDEEGHDELG